jgi:hypothetical protein
MCWRRGRWPKTRPGTNDPRHRTWRLTGGATLHDQIIDIALARERRMIEGVAPEDLETFLQVMRTMRAKKRRGVGIMASKASFPLTARQGGGARVTGAPGSTDQRAAPSRAA